MSVVHKLAASGGRGSLFALSRSSSGPASLSWCRETCLRPETASIFYKQRISSLCKNINGARAASRQFSKLTTEKAGKDAASSTKVVAAEQSSSTSSYAKFWNWYLGEKTMPPRWTLPWYREMVLICFVFAVTGSSTMVLVRYVVWRMTYSKQKEVRISQYPLPASVAPFLQVRPAVSKGLALKGSLKDGPWSYRICSLVVMTPIYATLLVVVGTVFGRHHYFRHFSVKMWSRFGIPPEMLDETYHITKKNFRKW
jgi:hypothetical protein